MEIWKSVVGYEGLYEVSNLGRVRSHHASGHRGFYNKEPHILSGGDVRGYRQIVLVDRNGGRRSGLIHRLVARAFLGEPPDPGHTVNHKDFDQSNNRVENLEWLSHADNNRYSAKVIPRIRGEQKSNRKLDETKVRDIRTRYAAGNTTLTALAIEYGVSNPTIHAIIHRRKWSHVQ